MKYICYYNQEKIYISAIKDSMVYEFELNYKTYPNIPKINYLEFEYADLIIKKINKNISRFKGISNFFGHEIIIASDDDFTDNEKQALLEKFINTGFKNVYLMEKSKLYKTETDRNCISMYSNERNCIISKIDDNKVLEKEIISKYNKEKIDTVLKSFQNRRVIMKIYGDDSMYCDSVIQIKEVMENMKRIYANNN